MLINPPPPAQAVSDRASIVLSGDVGGLMTSTPVSNRFVRALAPPRLSCAVAPAAALIN
ncbi:hypothetical protein B0H67DRAFT_582740 [Lasiosphaeris hirsuta]|uniref:Uncharacterized protein n=1 Tax=Lasiosphaeris hirsuta TaxID=260670 RepID=A0AA40AI38_9PEZI|nr:hypothetical protein B0H67DRAFT_582740 [Lasiosphaeris hirsuta]